VRYFQNIPNFEHPADPEPIGNATAPNTIVLKPKPRLASDNQQPPTSNPPKYERPLVMTASASFSQPATATLEMNRPNPSIMSCCAPRVMKMAKLCGIDVRIGWE